MFVKKTSKVNSFNSSIVTFLENLNYKKQDTSWSKGDILPENNIYRFIYDEHEEFSVSTFFINVGSDKDRYSIKLKITFECKPEEPVWEICEYKITRNTSSSDNLSYFTGHDSHVPVLLIDLYSAIIMKKEDWERQDE